MQGKIYTRRYCSYCVRAKQLLDSLGVKYQEIPVDGNPEAYETAQRESGQYTFPQIWLNGTHVGGCDDLYALHYNGKLAKLLGGESI